MLLAVAIILLILYVLLSIKWPGFALITSPIVAIVFLITCAEAESVGTVISPFIFVTTLIIISLSKPKSDLTTWPRTGARWLLLVLTLLILSALATILFAHWGSIGFAVVILFTTFLISYSITSRHAIAAYVISTIGSSMRQNLPLAMALESATVGRTDNRAMILKRIKKWLVQGYPLSEAIKKGYPKCPGYAVAIITAAEKINQLPFALKSLEADMVAKADENKRIRPIQPLYYPLVLFAFMSFIVWSTITFVIPKFREVLTEMLDEELLPIATRILIAITKFVAYQYGWLIGLIIILIFFVIVPLAIRIRFRPRRPDKPYLLSKIGDFIKWHLPILHWFEKNYSMVHVIEILRLSLNAGCTVNKSIANALDLDVNNCFKKRIRKWLTKVEAGENIAESAKKCGLGTPLVWAFEQKENPNNTLSVLQTLESFYRSNYSYAVNLARFIMWPCVTIIMGLTVGFVVYAVFSPIVLIITKTTESVTP